MKLVLYSGGQQRRNHRLHRAVVSLARLGPGKQKKQLKLTYIPFCSDDSETFFRRIIRRYRSHGVEQFFCLNVDASPTRDEIAEALSSDIIYLAGGNTFYFLKHLRESGMLKKLTEFAKRGGVLAGLSAGGLIMSPTVKLAADEGLGPDENEVNLKNFKAMGLFPFEFSPHFDPTQKQIAAHLAYSLKTKNPVYAVQDGGGIVIHGKHLEVLGLARIFRRGKMISP
jgi:dipeptidase E